MGWKTSETPLNLIHILPSDRDKTKPKLPYDNSQPLRIQVGDEAPSGGVKFFAAIIGAIRSAGAKIGEWLYTCVSLCQRGCQRVLGGLLSCVFGLLSLVKNGVGRSVAVVARLAKRAQASSEKISDNIWKMYTKKRNVSIPEPRLVPATIESPKNLVPAPKLERDELLWEVHALRDQLTAQRREFTRVNTQIGELKALALSQQQVLLHLGKELESIESKTVRTEKAAQKKPKPRSSKTAKAKPFPSSSVQSPREASIRFDPSR